jgi:hypothetical protein
MTLRLKGSLKSLSFRGFAALVVLAVSSRAGAAPGDLATDFRVNDENPVTSIPSLEQRTKNPLEFGYFIQDLVARAEGAFEKKDWARSVKYYEALAQAVPDRAISFRRLCSGYAELGNVDIAAANCGRALSLPGARVIDHFEFLNLSLRRATLTPKEIGELEASIAHVRAHIAANPQKPVEPPKPAPYDSAVLAAPPSPERTKHIKEAFMKRHEARVLAELEGKAQKKQQKSISLALEIEVVACKLAVRLRQEPKLTACVDALRTLKADERLIMPFEWARALVVSDAKRASALLDKAKALGLPEASVRAMREEQARAFAGTGFVGFTKRWGIAVVVGLAVGAGALVFFRALKRRKLATATAALPQ